MNKNVFFIWGTGKYSDTICSCYKAAIERVGLTGYIDNDTKKVGTLFHGYKVYSPDVLLENKNAIIFIAINYKKDVLEQIKRCYPWCYDNVRNDDYLIKQMILERYENSGDREVKTVIEYLKDNDLQVFNYDFTKKYDRKYVVDYDNRNGLYYINHNDKKMYFSRDFSNEESVVEYYKSIIVEQDEKSPHYYFSCGINYSDFLDSVVIDAGAAEGNFSLSVIDYVNKIYLFEPDEAWAEALSYTFEAYKDKVKIINKAVSNHESNYSVMIDKEIKEKHIDFIKLDIEGEEVYALRGAKKFLSQANIKCIVCSYHQEFAYDVITKELLELGFNVMHSNGYMYYRENDIEWRMPVLRRGLVVARK